MVKKKNAQSSSNSYVVYLCYLLPPFLILLLSLFNLIHQMRLLTWKIKYWKQSITSEILIRKKMAIDCILAQISNLTATNWDIEFVKSCLNQMIVKGFINEIYKTLIILVTEDTSPQNNDQTNFPDTTPSPSRHISTLRKSEG